MSVLRTRWAAIGAAVAVTLGAGGLGIADAAISSGERSVYVAITPCRLIDTRPAPQTVGPKSSPIGPAEQLTLPGTGTYGNCTIPSDAAALEVNLTALNATANTNLRFFPADADLPTAANLNVVAGEPPSNNSVTTKLSPAGEFKVANAFGFINVIIDVVGYYADHDHSDASEAITGDGVNVPDLVVQYEYFTETVTTTAAGQLLIAKYGHVRHSCSSGARWYFLVLDGTPLLSSVVYRDGATFWDGQIVGTTDDVIPAGEHEISIGGQCYVPTNYTSGGTTTEFSSLSVTVIP